MGSVGISFGSAASGAGFDVSTTVASIVSNLQAVEAPWKNQLTALHAQDAAFTSLGTDLATLSSSLQALTDFQGVMASKLGSSSDTNILSLGSAGPSTVAGSHTVVVSRLAQTSSMYSGVVPMGDKLSGGLTFQVGAAGTQHTVAIVSGVSDTLLTYASAINAADIGVRARVITDTNGSRLSFVSGTDGAAGSLTITSGGTVAATAVATSPAISVPATSSTPASNTFTLPSAGDLLSGTFSYRVGSGDTAAVPLGSTPLSLADAAASLNADSGFQNAGLVATMDGSNLIITGAAGGDGSADIDTSGSLLTTTTPAVNVAAWSDITSDPATGIPIKAGLAGQNALLNVDGIDVESASNTVSTAIYGVTFQLLAAAPDAQVQVQIVNDSSSVKSAFSTFVGAYNTIVTDMKAQEGKDASGVAKPLYGNPVLSQIQSALSMALTSVPKAGTVSSLYQLGISINQDGTLVLDTAALDSKLNSNFGDVADFLQSSGSFGQKLRDTLEQIGSQSVNGALSLALQSNEHQEETFNNNVSAQDALIDAQKVKLTNQLNLANEILQAIPQRLDEMNQLYSAITGYNTGR